MSFPGHNAFTDAIVRWEQAAEALTIAKEEEKLAREALVGMAFPAPVLGTNKYPLPDGLVLKAVFKNNYNLANGDGETSMVYKALPHTIRDLVIKFEPKLLLTGYNGLDVVNKALVNNVLTITKAMPAVEIVRPKG